ncbi:MAG: excinuclease ABC subunit UvrC [Candidatus Gastranaerophilales bacterium]|nr:excinuclease ABC subunit UvrC [Candidatus Gastranaerophilales bacterium]
MKKEITIKDRLKLLPTLPGVYLMYDCTNTIIYVGKAKSLKNRVKSYFNKTLDTPKLRVMVPQIIRFEFVITDSEIEALILESHLIKKHKPKYNILLKDDKKFPWFFITQEDYPRILITRRNRDEQKRKGKYFGPYTNSRAMYSTLEHIKKLFPLKQCSTPRFKDRPCIYYQMGRCLAPCQKLVEPSEYKKIVAQVELFLSGRQGELVEELKKQMELYAQHQQYEKAAKFRDSYFDIKLAIEKQKVVDENLTSFQDVIGIVQDDIRFVISLLEIRTGRLLNKKNFEILKNETDSIQEAVLAFLKNYYLMQEGEEIPKEVLLPLEIETSERTLIESWLAQKRNRSCHLIEPKTGKKHDLIELANKNASSYLEELKINDLMQLQSDWNEVGSYIKEKLNLPKFPHIVECFDISHTQGSNTVASMVIFQDGKPLKSAYKKYKIHSTEGMPDDFQSMKEVIRRRYSRLIKYNLPLPDLIIVDGGKGQLSSAVEVLEELNAGNQPIVSLAKQLEEIFLPYQSNPVIIPFTSPALFFFQRIRDEAHRFAISFHRKLRETQALTSILDGVKYLGEKRKKALYEAFKDIKGIVKAKRKDLEKIVGKTCAKALYNKIRQSK